MNEEKPISLAELLNRVNTEGEPQLEDGIVLEAPRGWFENVQHQVDTTEPSTASKPDRAVQ